MENRVTNSSSFPSSLSGALIVAHPGLLDPNFRKAVVLVSSHAEEDGAVGTIINHPLGQTLAEHDPSYVGEPLGAIQLYRGGPVASNEVIFMAWQWSPAESVFRLAYGLDPEQAGNLLGTEGYEVRGFLGYTGWGRRQLEDEIAHDSWVVSGVDAERLREGDGEKLWRDIVAAVSPEMKILAEAPEDPTRN